MSAESGVILLYGDDAARIDRALEEHINKALPDPAARAFCLESFDGDTTDVDTLLLAARSRSFFAGMRVLCIREPVFLEAAARKKGSLTISQEKELLAYCEAPNPESLIIMRMITDDKPGAFLKKLAQAVKAVPFSKPRGADIAVRIRKSAQAAGHQLRPEALSLLEEAAQNMDTARMKSELDKLFLSVGEQVEISEKDVRNVLTPTTGTTIFNLTDAIVAGRTERAAEALHDCLYLGMKPPQILYQTEETVRRILMVQSMLEEHMSADAITTAIGRHAYYVKKLIQNARSLSTDILSRLYIYLVDCDVRSKSTAGLDMAAFIEEVVINSATACAVQRRR